MRFDNYRDAKDMSEKSLVQDVEIILRLVLSEKPGKIA